MCSRLQWSRAPQGSCAPREGTADGSMKGAVALQTLHFSKRAFPKKKKSFVWNNERLWHFFTNVLNICIKEIYV